jgi:hypothetical protein
LGNERLPFSSGRSDLLLAWPGNQFVELSFCFRTLSA